MEMTQQQQSSRSTLAVVLGILAVLAVIIALGVNAYISSYNYGNEAEKGIIATYKNNENILSQYTQKVQEVAQVPGMYRDDLQKVLTSAIQAQYGSDGSKAMFQWFKERQISIDAKMYTKIQQVIEAGRNEFQAAQTELIAKHQAYETNLGYFWRGMWLKIAGYPKIDLAKYQPITNTYASDAFKKGKEEGPLKLRQE